MPGSLEPLDLDVQIPYHFRCPISLELMRDPVTVSTGQTYDRLSIESWVATGNDTCPVTRSPLTEFTLIPNHTLRRLIQDWCVQNRSFGVERIPTPKQPADSPTVRALISQSSAGNLAALRRLRILARDSEKNRNLISSLGASSILLSLAFSSGSGSASEIQLEALSIAVTLPKFSEEECLSIAEDPEKIEFLSELLRRGSPEATLSAGAMIEIAISGTRDADVRASVAGAPGVIQGVLEILRRHKEFEFEFGGRAARIGVRAIFAMCVARRAREIVAAAGAAAVLVEKLGELESAEAERALAAVELLCRTVAGVESLAGAAAALVKVMMRVSERATEYAAGALLALCTAAEGCRREAAAAGVVTQLLLLVQSDCTERAKRKAQSLLKLLRDSWPIDCFVIDSRDFACSEVVLLPFSNS